MRDNSKRRSNIFNVPSSDVNKLQTAKESNTEEEEQDTFKNEDDRVRGSASNRNNLISSDAKVSSQAIKTRINLFDEKSASRERILTSQFSANKQQTSSQKREVSPVMKDFQFLMLANKQYEPLPEIKSNDQEQEIKFMSNDFQQIGVTLEDDDEQSNSSMGSSFQDSQSIQISNINKQTKNGQEKSKQQQKLKGGGSSTSAAQSKTVKGGSGVSSRINQQAKTKQNQLPQSQKEQTKLQNTTSKKTDKQSNNYVSTYKSKLSSSIISNSSSARKPQETRNNVVLSTNSNVKSQKQKRETNTAQKQRNEDGINLFNDSQNQSMASIRQQSGQPFSNLQVNGGQGIDIDISNHSIAMNKIQGNNDFSDDEDMMQLKQDLQNIGSIAETAQNDTLSQPDNYINMISDQGAQIQRDTIVVGTNGFNRKEERIKTKIAYDIMEQVLYNTVVPSELRSIASDIDQYYKRLQSDQESMQQNNVEALDLFYEQSLLKPVLIGFLNEFCNVTNGKPDSEKALKMYIENQLIEQANFNLCSEIWNDFLMLPQIAKEDPNICANNLIHHLISEIASECIQSEKNGNQNLKSKQLQSYQKNSKNNKLQTYSANPISLSQKEIITNDEIIKQYIDQKLIDDIILEQTEDIAMMVMQEILFYKQQLEPQLISEQIFDSLISHQLQLLIQESQRKERILNKGADNHLLLFLKSECRQIASETIQQEQSQQLKSASKLTKKENLNQSMSKKQAKTAQISTTSNQNLVQGVSQNMIADVTSQLIFQIITNTITVQKDSSNLSQLFINQMVNSQVQIITKECVEEIIIGDVIEQLVDKITEDDVWRGAVREHQVNEAASYQCLEEILDNQTKQFFQKEYNWIKDQYLRHYRDQVKKAEIKEIAQFNVVRSPKKLNENNQAREINEIDQINLYEESYDMGSNFVSPKNALSPNNDSVVDHIQNIDIKSPFMNESLSSDQFFDCNPGTQSSNRTIDQFNNTRQQSQNQNYTFNNDANKRQSTLEDTMIGFNDIEEGQIKITTIREYYVIPQIKSINFLNLHHMDLFPGLRQTYSRQSYTSKRHEEKDKVLPLDSLAIDVLCVNCYECIKIQDVDTHSLDCNFNTFNKKKATSNDNQNINKQNYSSSNSSYEQQFYETNKNSTLQNQNHYQQNSPLYNHKFDGQNTQSAFNYYEENIIANIGDQMNECKQEIEEINEKIFKLHKAIRQKQIEEQQKLEGDMNLLRHLDDFEQLAINIFINNTNKNEIEMLTSDLIEKLKVFKPVSGHELSLNITARRLAQLALHKIQQIEQYNLLAGKDKQNKFNPNDESQQSINQYSNHFDNEDNDFATQMLQLEKMEQFSSADNSVSSFRLHQNNEQKLRYQQQQFNSQNDGGTYRDNQYDTGYDNQLTPLNEDHFRQLEEETKQQKAELEIWRNLHNEMLKNYLMTKATNNKCINDINSDVSSSHSNVQSSIDDKSSFAGSQLGGGSSVSGFGIDSPFRKRQGFNNTTGSQHQFEEQSDVGQLDEVEETLRYKQKEDLKRYFYTIAIHNSKKILKTIPQGSTLKHLYHKCTELDLPVGDWDAFIQKELKQKIKPNA